MAIKFGSEVYTWFMDGYGEGNDNKLPHMAKIIGEAGFSGIEPMVLEPYDTYWLCLLYTSPSPRDQRGSRLAAWA